jgi:hypothetical protein
MGLPMPQPAQLAKRFGAAYALIDAVGDDVGLELRNASGGYDPPIIVKAKVSGFKTTDLIPGGPVVQGDFRAIIRFAALPAGMRPMDKRDRVTWAGRPYAVLNWDAATHALAGTAMAVELWLKG